MLHIFRYDDSPFGSKRKDDLGWGSNGKSSQWDMDRFDSKHSTSVIEEIPSRKPDEDKGRSRRTYEAPKDDGAAQKKFGNAKAISSDAYFGKHEADVSGSPVFLCTMHQQFRAAFELMLLCIVKLVRTGMKNSNLKYLCTLGLFTIHTNRN